MLQIADIVVLHEPATPAALQNGRITRACAQRHRAGARRINAIPLRPQVHVVRDGDSGAAIRAVETAGVGDRLVLEAVEL